MAEEKDAEGTEAVVAELHKKIKEAFEVFDHESNNTVDVREIGTIIRSLGCCPTEGELHDFIAEDACIVVPERMSLFFGMFSVTSHKNFITGLLETDIICVHSTTSTLAYKATNQPDLEVHFTACILCVPFYVTCGPVDTLRS
ncbi:dynein regulatory complex protein 8 isoform X3 [Arvicanthis niloticus]|uniref:dynein regulatory complex protein 8 isoform X3 n=1 Tax=Arvicanthis niloticus TaxID=61156 RepID=UPI00402B91EB